MKLGGLTSLTSSRSLNEISRLIARQIWRLSAGHRFDSPKNNVAAYALDIRLDSQMRSIVNGIRNLNAGLGLLQTGQAALSQQMDLIGRMRELSIGLADGIKNASEREILQREMNSLLEEYQRITQTTEFNGVKLLDGSHRSLQLSSDIEIDLLNLNSSKVFKESVGTGVFSNRTTVSTGDSPQNLVIEDLNGDGNLDVAAISIVDDQITIHFGDGSGAVREQITLSPGVNFAGGDDLRAGDFNGDGITDLYTSAWIDGQEVIWLGQGDGQFGNAIIGTPGVSNVNDVQIGDMNGDGFDDLILSSSTELAVMLSNGDGTFTKSQSFGSMSSGSEAKIADIDGDGNLDIVLRLTTAGEIRSFLGDGAGQFSLYSTLALASNIAIDLGDYDNDGDIDLLASVSGSIGVYTNDGTGAFTWTSTISGVTNNRAIFVDLNNDGLLDIASQGVTTLQLITYLGNGAGSFSVNSTTTLGAGAGSFVFSGDFNNDGAIDLFSFNPTNDQWIIYENDQTVRTALGKLSDINSRNISDVLQSLDDAQSILMDAQNRFAVAESRIYARMDFESKLSNVYVDAREVNRGIDYALEIAELTRLQVLQQAALAMHTQVLQRGPALALLLLEPLT